MKIIIALIAITTVLFSCQNKTESTDYKEIGLIYNYSMQQPDSIVKTYEDDSSYFTINKYLHGDVIYSGDFNPKSNEVFGDVFIDQSDHRSIRRSYYPNRKLKFERIDLKMGVFTFREWDSIGNIIYDSIKHIKY